MTTPDDPQHPDYDAYRYPGGPGSGPGNAAPGPDSPQSPAGTPQPGYQAYGSYDAYDPGAPGYAGASAGNWAVDTKSNGVAPWALGVAVLSLIMALSVIGTALAAPVGIIGLILGIIAVVKARGITGPGRRMGMSVTSVVLSVIAVVLSLVFWFFITAFITESGAMDCMEITDPAEQQTCFQESVENWLNSNSTN